MIEPGKSRYCQTRLKRRISWNENLQQKQNWTAKSTNLEENAWKVFRVALWTENLGRCHDYFGSSKISKENLQLQSTLEAIRFLNRNTEYMFAISFRKHRDEKRKATCYLWLSKCKFSLLAPSLCQQRALVLFLHRVKQTRFLTNQRARFLRTVF